MKMGFLSNNIFIIFFIIFTPFFFQNTHILIAEGQLIIAEESFHGLHLKQLDFMEEKHKIEKVAGVDESEEKEISLVEKFRALLGFKSLNLKNPPNAEDFSPSPSPLSAIEAPARAPLPSFRSHKHSHPALHHSQGSKKGHTSGDEGDVRTLVAVLVPTGAVILICVLGLIWVCKKLRKERKKPTRTISVTGKKGGRTDTSKYANNTQKSEKYKVSSNHGLDDLFYQKSLEMDLEQQSGYPVKTSKTVKPSLNHNTPECTSQEILHSGNDNLSNSSSKDIVSIHEDETESIKFESDCANSSFADRIISVEVHLSDDESFHSFVDSHSSMAARLSNASKGSHSDTSEILTDNVMDKSLNLGLSMSSLNQPETTHFLCNLDQRGQITPSPVNNPKSFTNLPPPPPPPPPPLSISVPSFSLSRRSSPYSTRASSSTLPYLSSPLKLDSSSRSIPMPPAIPPPLSPPILSKVTDFSIKTPPPLPSQRPNITPLGKDGSPLPKLKPLHWDKVRATPDRSMVWDKLRSSSFELDEEMIESLFGYNLQNSVKNEDTKSKSPSPSKHILEPKRLQNLTILFKALNVTVEQVGEALEQGNGLRLAQIEALIKMVPTMEEEAKLLSFKGNINDLGSAERFVIVVLRIPFAFQRVEAMIYRETFEDEVVHLRNSFSMLEDACKELKSSRLFLKLLEAVLKTGNRMNFGTIRGGARAFKLDALLKLADVKGTDGKTTLLHFVVQEIIRSEGIRVSESIMGKISQKNKSKTAQEREEYYRKMGLDLVSGLSTELYNVKKTASVDLDVLATSVSYLSDGIAKLIRLVHKDLYVDERSEVFINSMKSFINYAEKILKELQEDENRVLFRVKEITEYFHGDLSKEEGNPLRIFVIVRDFLGMLDNVCKELRSSKIGRSRSPLAPFR